MSNHFGLHEKRGVKEMKIRLSGSDRDEFLSKTEEFVFSGVLFFNRVGKLEKSYRIKSQICN